jgi:hypothetical protein
MKPVQIEINKNGCHICISHVKDKDGYPIVKRNGKLQSLVRFLWMEKNKIKLPSSLYICHRCDNRACVNLEHVFLGTVTENNRDKYIKRLIRELLSLPLHEQKQVREAFNNERID